MTRGEDFLTASSLRRELRQRAADSPSESLELARAAGQDPQLLAKIEAGAVHPAMVAFGLLKDDSDFEDLVKDARRPGIRGSKRPDLKL